MELVVGHRPGDVVREERDTAIAALEEVVAVAVVPDAGDQLHLEEVAPEADRLLEVGGDEGEMVQACEDHGSSLSFHSPPSIGLKRPFSKWHVRELPPSGAGRRRRLP
jgi:hypothetical protein